MNCQGNFLDEISLYTELNEEKSGLCQGAGQHVQMSWSLAHMWSGKAVRVVGVAKLGESGGRGGGRAILWKWV